MEASMQPFDFACAMREHWTDNLGNASSSALMSMWVVMAQTFNSAIDLSYPERLPSYAWRTAPIGLRGDPEKERGQWHILQPPTGSGKTQGVRIYSAMMAMMNASETTENRVGILIVTREIEEADKLASQINTSFVALGGQPGRQVALARHSKNASAVTKASAFTADILVVTHAAYVRALDRFQQADDDKWSAMIEWEAGRRRLTVVDETITNLVESYQLNIEKLKQVKGYISEPLRRRFPQQVVALEAMEVALRRLQGRRIERDETRSALGLSPSSAPSSMVWGNDNRWKLDAIAEASAHYDMSGLRQAMLAVEGSTETTLLRSGPSRNRKGLLERTAIAKLADETLKAVEAVFSRWAYYANNGSNSDTLNTSRLILPDHFPGPVVLDATASQDVLWSLLGDKVRMVHIAKGVRSYANVTLNVAYADGLGKHSMVDQRRERIGCLIAHLNSRFAGQQRTALLVCHKDVEPEVAAHAVTFGRLSTAHWGAVDGKNDWEDHDTVVIFGMPFRDAIWANNLFLAINDHKGSSPALGELQGQSDDTFRDLSRRQLTVSIVQSLNRIRCRRVTDAEGNCPPAEAFLVLPRGDIGGLVLEAIKAEMPGVVVQDWAFSLCETKRGGPRGPLASVRQGSSHERLVAFLKAMRPGAVTIRRLREELGLTAKGAEKLSTAIRDPSTVIAQALQELEVAYVRGGGGPGSSPQLVKAGA